MIKPMGDWVVCKMPKVQEQTGSGLIIPESAQWAPIEALVLAMGPRVALEVRPGDRVVHDFLAGLEVADKDWGTVLMLQQKDIQGVLTA